VKKKIALRKTDWFWCEKNFRFDVSEVKRKQNASAEKKNK